MILAPLKHPARVGLLVALATVANLFPLPVPGDAVLFLGPLFYMPVVLSLRLPWVAFAAAVPAGVVLREATPASLVIFTLMTLEAVWLGALRRRVRSSLLIYDAVFWLAAALLIFVGVHTPWSQTPGEIVAVGATLQIITQFASVTISIFLIRHTGIPSWLNDHLRMRQKMRDGVLHAVFVLAFVPLVALALGMAALLRAYCDREDDETLHEATYRLSHQLDLYIGAHEAAVAEAANLVTRAAVDPAVMLSEVRRTHPAFIAILLADATGRVVQVASSQSIGPEQIPNISERIFFRSARDSGRPVATGVFKGHSFTANPLIAVSAPIYDAQGRFAGVIEGLIEAKSLALSIITNQDFQDGVDVIFVDALGRNIYAEPGTGLPALARLRHHPQGVLLAAGEENRVAHFDVTNADGERCRLAAAATRAVGSSMTVIAQRPLLSALDGSGWFVLLFVGVAASVMIAALLVARRAQQGISAPLEHFAETTLRQAALRMAAPIEERFANAPYEVWTVFRTFNHFAIQLRNSYTLLQRNNEELDRRVAERTQEAETARRQAEAASRSKSDFLAMTSHEIRTPLNAIIGLADSLGERVQDPVATDRLRIIANSGRNLLTVINDLLDISRVEAGKLDLRPAPVELGALCEEVRTLFAFRAEQQDLKLETDIAPLPCWIETDATRVQQVLINLIGNALKFTPTGGVRLEVRSEPGADLRLTLAFSVTDTGPGMTAEEQARLFQPYVQLAGGTQSPFPGTGLGLSISRRLVELLGGTLGVRSEIGRGTEFFFTIQTIGVPAPVSEIAIPSTTGIPDCQLPRVLAADDAIANQEVLRSILEGRCARLTIVDDATAALTELEQNEYDVALIDLEMPDADGASVARAVRSWRALEASRGCRLIAFSAHARQDVWADCAESGFDDYVEKPIDRQQLIRALTATPVLAT